MKGSGSEELNTCKSQISNGFVAWIRKPGRILGFVDLWALASEVDIKCLSI